MKIKKILSLVSAAVLLGVGAVAVSLNVSASPTDPNGDGVIDLLDVIYIRKYLAGTICPTDISQLDYNGNGVVSEVDAYIIARNIL